MLDIASQSREPGPAWNPEDGGRWRRTKDALLSCHDGHSNRHPRHL